jgi:type II secretory pathway component PulF
MPTFHYVGRDARGSSIKGALDATSESEIAAILVARQVIPTAIRPAPQLADEHPFWGAHGRSTPSPVQLELARAEGRFLDPGYTWVRGHNRGTG